MAQIIVLKSGDASGYPREADSAADDLTLNSFAAGAGPVMSATGVDMNNTDLSEVSDIDFQDPSVSTIEQTAGALIIDNIMAKERNNVMTTAGAVLFPSVSDTAGQLDSFKLPHLAGAPTATPAFSSDAGYAVYDDTNNRLYVWDGAAWQDQTSVSSTAAVDKSYIADVAVAARDVVYISSSGEVSPADANTEATSRVVGLATAAAAASVAVSVRSMGVLSGFSALTAGARYFLSASTPGAITATAPSGSNDAVIQVGYAKSATELDIMIQVIYLKKP